MIKTGFLGVILWMGLSVTPAATYAGPEVCAGSSPTVCVRFDDRSATPIATFDFIIDLGTPSAPIVRLLRSADQQQMYEWRVWSVNSQDQPDVLDSITAPGAYNYAVRLQHPNGQAGVSHLAEIQLTPPGDHHSSLLPGSRIGGVLEYGMTLQQDSADVGGELNLEVGNYVAGGLEIPVVRYLDVPLIAGGVTIGKTIGTYTGGCLP